MGKILTIVIPTYNRRNQLLRLLKTIDSQDCIDLYSIVILDNCSNYSIEDAVGESFSVEFFENIRFERRPVNAGADYNIGSAFVQASNGLMWVVGDDDELCEGAIARIIDNYERYPKVAFFKYSMQEKKAPSENILMENTEDLITCYKKQYLLAGDLIFLSNNVFNVDLIKDYFSDCLYYSYCSVPHFLPMMHCLVDSDKCVMLCKDVVVKYNAPEGDHWNFIKIVTSFSTVLDINWGNHHKEIRSIFKVLSVHFGLGQFLQDCIAINDRSYRRYIYWKGMNTVFDRRKNLQDYFAILLYKLELYTKVKFLSGFYSNLYRKQNEIKLQLKTKAQTNPQTARLVSFLKKYFPKLK